jgi:hypothetical protein
MIKIIDRLNNFIDKVGLRNFILFVFIVVVVIISGLYGTFSLFTTSSVSYIDNVKNYKFIIGDSDSDKLTIDSMDSKYIDITISNQESIDLLYSLYYKTEDANVIVGVLEDSDNKVDGTIKSNSDYTVSLRVFNNSSTSADITFGVNYGTLSGGEIQNDGTKITEVIKNLDQSGANEPNLVDGMIPVLYDEESEEWVKADSENMNSEYKWYDYSNSSKMWANGVLVSSEKRDEYLNSKVGTIIDMNDVLAFYVWVPRYKYHVWNVTRKVDGSEDYSYDAFDNGIDIEFESGTDTTGDMICSYNTNITNIDNVLVDNCKYNNNTITVDNNNSDYKDVWYTHQAFNYGNKKLTGFWVGKFETTGTEQAPSILPDQKSLTNLNIANFFKVSELFKNYGLGNAVDGHILKNMEWGALAYLTYSDYGICSNSICRELYINNSKSFYTGRSGGDVAGSDNLVFNKIYVSEGEITNKYSDYGYYNYQGYLIDENGNVTTTKDKSKISYTTGNIYGVYDLVGGAMEVVMANSLNKEQTFNKSNSGFQTELEEKYYDSYIYSIDSDILSLNRTRMGDAVGEVSVLRDDSLLSWSSLYREENDGLSFVNDTNPWLVRGGFYNQNDAGIFKYDAYDGKAVEFIGVRQVLS